MRKFGDLAQLSIGIAVLLLSIRLGGDPDAPNVKLTELFIALATALTIWRIAIAPASDCRLKTLLGGIYPLLGIFYVSMLLGTLASVLTGGSFLGRLAAVEYARILVSTILFLLILYHGHAKPRFIVLLYCAFMAPIGIAVFSRVPGAVESLSMTTDGGTRFKGLFEDPNYFASFTLISAVFLYSMILHLRGKLLLRLLAMPALVLITSTLLWSGSRSGWLGLLAGWIIVALTTVRFSTSRVRTAGLSILLIGATLCSGFLLLPNTQQTATFARAGVRYEPQQASPETPSYGDLRLPFPSISVGQAPLTHGQDRINIWRQVLEHFRTNPLGYGPGYYQAINIVSAGDEHRSSHSIIFETIATGGILALILLTYVAYLTVRLWVKRAEADYVWIGIYAAFIGVLVSSLFLDSLSLRWLWALGAMLVCYSRKDARAEQDASSC